MTVSAQTPINRSTGNGVTTVFPYTFKIIAAGDIEVSLDDVVKTLNVDYTVSGAGNDAGGNVTMTTAPASGVTVVRRRNMAIVRTTDYQDQGTLPAATLDSDIDATVLMAQQLNERLDRTFSLPISSSADNAMPEPQAGYVLGWDALGESLTNLPAAVGTSLIDLAASGGSALVGYLPGGAGSVITDVQTRLRECYSVYDKMNVFQRADAASGTPLLDHTAAIQSAIDALPAGATLTGAYGTFGVTTLNLKSNMAFKNANFKTIGGAVDFVAPITIDGTSSSKTNIFLKRVVIDGNRVNQADIITASEDGGRHGFRVIGRVANLTLKKCKATYCACDGIEIHASSSQNFTDDLDPCFSNIKIKDCEFNWNRRIGISAHSVDGLLIEDTDTLNNGRSVGAFIANTHGNMGATVGNDGVSFYGNGVDIEGYNVGSRVSNVKLINVKSTGGYRGGIYFYDAVDPLAVGFASRDNILIQDCITDKGLSGAAGDTSIAILGDPANETLHNLYKNVRLVNNKMEGATIRGSDLVLLTGNTITMTATTSLVFTNSVGVNVDKSNIFPGECRYSPATAGQSITYVEAYQTTAQVIGVGVSTKVLFDSLVWDDTGEWSSSTFTAQTFGVFNVAVTLGLNQVPLNDCRIYIKYGGVSVPLVTRQIMAVQDAYATHSASIQIRLDAGDTVEIWLNPLTVGCTTLNGKEWSNVTIARVR